MIDRSARGLVLSSDGPARVITPGQRLLSLATAAARVGKLVLPFVFVVGVWELAASVSGVGSRLFPRPGDVATAAFVLAQKGILPAYTFTSLKEWLLGSTTGVAVGTLFGLVLAFSHALRALLMPLIRFFTAIAEVAWLPLVILWFQFGPTTVLFVIWYTVVFPVLFNILGGIEAIPRATRDAVRTLGADRLQMVREVLLPGALPSLVVGFRIGAGYAFRTLIVAEVFASGSGLGFMIFESRQTGQTSRTVVGMIVLGCLWLIIDRIYLRAIEVATVERWGLTGNL